MLDGNVTSLMLEPTFWHYLEQLAEEANLSWADYTRFLLEEIGVTDNRAASIKEWLLRQARRTIPTMNGERVHDHGHVARWEVIANNETHVISTSRPVILVGSSPN